MSADDRLAPADRSLPHQLLHGAALLVRGARWIATTPALWPWAAAPTLLTLLALVGAVSVAMGPGGDLATWLLPATTGTWGTLAAIGRGLVQITILALSAVVGVVLAGLLAAPFHDRLSATLEARLRPHLPAEPFVFAVFVGDVAQGIAHSLMALGLWIGVAVPLLVLNLIPGVGSAAYAVLSTVLSAFVFTREQLDLPLSRRRYAFGTKLGIVRDHWITALGFGVTGVVVLFIPFANLVVLPIAVAGATLWFVELDDAGVLPTPPVSPHQQLS